MKYYYEFEKHRKAIYINHYFAYTAKFIFVPNVIIIMSNKFNQDHDAKHVKAMNTVSIILIFTRHNFSWQPRWTALW